MNTFFMYKTLNMNADTRFFAHVCLCTHVLCDRIGARVSLCVLIGLQCKSLQDVSGQKMNAFLIRVFLLELGQMAY